MAFDWEEYEAQSGTEEVSLLLSERSQQLILSAMNSMLFRENWLAVDDTTWNEIDEAVAEAYEEIMEEIPPVTETVLGALVSRTSNESLAANVAELITWQSGLAYGDSSIWDSGDPTKLSIPSGAEGFWLVSGMILFQASTSSQKVLRVRINTTERYLQGITFAAQQSMTFNYLLYSTGGDDVTIEVLSPTAVTLTGTNETLHARLVRVAAQ